MKFIESIKRLKLSRLLIEAVLIFSSVYAAFLLEDKRSKRFERELLQQKLQSHLKIMQIDSITFESRLLGNINSKTNEGLKESIINHRKALDLLETQTNSGYRQVYDLHKSGKLLWRIIQGATKSQHQLDVTSENYDHLIIIDSTRHFIERYTYHTWVINQFVENSDQYIDDLSLFARENYFVFSQLENERDIIEYVSHPYYYNSIKSHLNTIEILLGMRQDFFEDFSSIKQGFVKELEQQEAHL